MYYSSIGILGLLVLIIINADVLRISSRGGADKTQISYRNFLYSVIGYYITDVLWEGLYALKLTSLIFVETTVYFAIMALSVFLWTQYIIAYLKIKKTFSVILNFTGRFFLAFQIAVLTINFLYPIAFWFDSDCIYHVSLARLLNLAIQFVLFLTTALYTMIYTKKYHGKNRNKYRTIWTSSLTLTIFVAAQAFHPFMPFYSIGYLLATTLIHTFVQEAEKAEHQQELERLLQVEEIQEKELGSVRLMAYTDPLTGVKSKHAYQEDVLGIEKRIEDGILKDFGVIVLDVNNLKLTNDTKGHDEGDRLIKNASRIIGHAFKRSPVYRIGGDEFTVFLMGEDFKKKEELIASFNRQIEKNKTDGKIVIASGFASYDELPEKNYKALFELADKRMYERKKELKGEL